ncbi:DMT family transporter [Stutzerimonas xanthomarina]|uniref:DMT family transporter n=2 Tax=Stutzerimonas xanthomarina TaxID=271420 RepID=UPI000ADA92DF
MAMAFMGTARMGAVLVAMAALCWGFSGGIAGVLLSDGWDAYVVSFFRGAIGLVSVLLWLALRPGASGLANRKLWFWSVIAALGVAGNFAFYFLSIRQSSVAVAATLMYCAPVFVYLVSFVLKLERSTPLKWVGIGVVMLGIVLLTGVYENGAGSVTLTGAGAGLLAGLSYAVFIFGFKYAAPHGTPQAILVIAFAALVTVFIWLSRPTRSWLFSVRRAGRCSCCWACLARGCLSRCMLSACAIPRQLSLRWWQWLSR